jgi:hypothetical protein
MLVLAGLSRGMGAMTLAIIVGGQRRRFVFGLLFLVLDIILHVIFVVLWRGSAGLFRLPFLGLACVQCIRFIVGRRGSHLSAGLLFLLVVFFV